MATYECPLCGSRVAIANSELKSRHVCRKCHSPFHLNKAGIPVVGEPPSIDVELAEMKQKLHDTVSRIPFTRILVAGSALVVLLILGYLFFGPAERLDSAGMKAANALAKNDASYLKSIATPGTSDDVVRWFDIVHQRLTQARQHWHGGQEEMVECHVGEEDRTHGKGSVLLSIHRALGGGLDVSLADPSAATASADAPFEVDTVWTLSRLGHWQLDGHATFAMVKPSP